MRKIPLHIVSGFLGSGKTTFLKRIIEELSSDCKTGIIQNEFAPSGIDGNELRKIHNDICLLEVNNGSVFCDCLSVEFVHSLEKFILEKSPELLILEASGLSDTTSVTEIISSGHLSELVTLGYNWCIVDAVNFLKAGLMKERIVRQLRMADFVLINKSDLIENPTEKDKIYSEVKSINPFAEIAYTSYCDIGFKPDAKSMEKFYPDSKSSLKRPDVNAMVIRSGRKFYEEDLVRFLNEWAPKAYRMKGFVNLKDGKTTAVQCVYDRIEMSEAASHLGPSELIVLSDQFKLCDLNRSFRQYT